MQGTKEKPIRIAGHTVEPGTMAALRFEVQGIVDGKPAIVVEHVTRGAKLPDAINESRIRLSRGGVGWVVVNPLFESPPLFDFDYRW